METFYWSWDLITAIHAAALFWIATGVIYLAQTTRREFTAWRDKEPLVLWWTLQRLGFFSIRWYHFRNSFLIIWGGFLLEFLLRGAKLAVEHHGQLELYADDSALVLLGIATMSSFVAMVSCHVRKSARENSAMRANPHLVS